jgi:hypothetical protein
MLAIQNPNITFVQGKYRVKCKCGNVVSTKYKVVARSVDNRGTCRACVTHRLNKKKFEGIYKVENGWAKKCSGCNVEQVYTRKDHAKSSVINNWNCRTCSRKMVIDFNPVGDYQREYNRFKTMATNRKIEWNITIIDMFANFNGKCALTGWDISLKYGTRTASLDRIDNTKGYLPNNIQWVHSMVNMSKNKYDNAKFIEMCCAIAEKNKCVSL